MKLEIQKFCFAKTQIEIKSLVFLWQIILLAISNLGNYLDLVSKTNFIITYLKIYFRVINCQASSSYLQIEELYRSFSLGFTFILLCSVYLCLQNIFNLSPLEIHHFQHILGLRINLNNILLQSGNIRNVVISALTTGIREFSDWISDCLFYPQDLRESRELPLLQAR